MKIATTFASLALLATSSSTFGAAGMFDQFVFVTTDGSTPAVFYDIGATTANADFAGSDLGTFDLSQDILSFGGQQKTFKNNGTDVTSSSLFFRIFPSDSAPTGSFTEVTMPFQFDNVNGVFGDQQWGGDQAGSFTVSSNVLSGLSPGSYTVEVYTRITTNGVDAAGEIFNNVGGTNYAASFTTVPEPSSLLLSMLVGTGLVLRRRR